MYEVSSEATFSAAHALRNYDGPCENVHGHNWLVRATVRCDQLDHLGLGIDFRELRANLADIVGEMDHTDLNSTFDEQNGNPSSENLARYIYHKLSERINDLHRHLQRVDVHETPGNCAAYFEE